MKKLLFLAIILTLDQLTKHTPFWEKTCNPYISWSIPLHGPLLWMFITIAFLFLLYTLKKENFPYSLLLIAAGAIGNIIDRLHLNCVIDFISINLPLIGTFPTFNLADAFITIGAVLFFWQAYLADRQEFKTKK
jgi:lipoprotein signal peptidase